MTKARANTPFVDTSRAAATEEKCKRSREFKARAESLTRLVGNGDFRAWLGYLHYEFCAGSFGMEELTTFEQGKRAAFAFILKSLAAGEGASELIGSFTRNHYEAIAGVQRKAWLET